ncbi:hypothetical protein [Amycolatopsis sp. NPDC059021]|uniref:hypothetical protein n=1 Tax=Amycolatopsis sp. NPDC059021 TaxID=3346704 RepID=UPI003670E72D
MAEQLEPVPADRFATLPGNEVNAAFLAVEDALNEADLMACGHAKHHQVGELLSGIPDRAEGVIREKLVPPRNIREARSLSTIGPRILRYLPATLDSSTEHAAAATVRAAALTGGSEALAVLKRYAPAPRPAVQEQTITTGRLLPFAKQLRQLTDLPYPKTISAHFDEDAIVNLHPLAKNYNINTLPMSSAKSFTRIATLDKLSTLQTLLLFPREQVQLIY